MKSIPTGRIDGLKVNLEVCAACNFVAKGQGSWFCNAREFPERAEFMQIAHNDRILDMPKGCDRILEHTVSE